MIEEYGFTEKWKEIPGYPNYWVSDTGRVINSDSGRQGYLFVRNKRAGLHVRIQTKYHDTSLSLNKLLRVLHGQHIRT